MKGTSRSDSILIPLHADCIAEYLAMFSPTVRQCLGVSSADGEYTYLQESLVRMQQGKTLFYCIITETHQLIGAVEMRCIPYHASHIYTWINESFWGQGYFKRAMHQAAHTYFMTTGFPFVIAHIDIHNTRSYHAFKSCGFSDWGFCMGSKGKQYCLVLRASTVLPA